MTAALQDLLAYGAAQPHVVGLVVFAAAFLESIALVGTFIPGSLVLIAAGALVAGGVAPLPLALWGIAGAVAGDGVSYWLGRHYRSRLRAWRWIARNPQRLDRSERFLRRHGAKSVLFARFVGTFRAIVPLVAGMAGMAPLRFLAVDLLSAVLWVPAMLLAGALLGSALGLAASVSTRLLLLCVLTVLAMVAMAWGLRLLLRYAVPALIRLVKGLMRWAEAGQSPPQRLLFALLRPAEREVPFVALLGLLGLGALWAFIAIVEGVLSKDSISGLGEAVFHLIQELRTPWADTIMLVTTAFGDGIVVTGVTIAAVAWLLWRRAWWAAACLASAVVLTSVFVQLLKALLRLPRPFEELYSGWSAFAFPSGHAATNAALYGMLVLLLLREIRPRWAFVLITLAGAFIGLIGISRLYLGAHWLPDVLAGFVFAGTWIALIAAAYLHRARERVGPRGLLACTFASLAVIGGWHTTQSFDRLAQRYDVQRQPQILDAAAWWDDGWRRLPERRTDLEGEPEERFALQWAGRPAALEAALRPAGWRRAPAWSVKGALQWLAPTLDPKRLPVLPRLSDGRRPLLSLIKTVESDASSRLVLRLWLSDFALNHPGRATVPILLGTVMRERVRSIFGVVPASRTLSLGDAGAHEFAQLLPNARLVARRDSGSEPSASTVLAHDASLQLGAQGLPQATTRISAAGRPHQVLSAALPKPASRQSSAAFRPSRRSAEPAAGAARRPMEGRAAARRCPSRPMIYDITSSGRGRRHGEGTGTSRPG